MIYRLLLSYDGGPFAGWQRQANALTLQQTLEEALGDLLGTEIVAIGAGRTDAGVHARGQVAHFELARPFPLRGLVHGANHRLPAALRVLAAEQAPEGFHAQRSAIAKEYVYRLLVTRVPSPLDAPYAMTVAPLDLAAIRAALALLPGRHDFSAFALSGGSHKHGWRRLFAATLEGEARDLRLRFVGEGFLRGMVRSLVGTLLEVGRGERGVEGFGRLLEPGRGRGDAGMTAEARGLCLEKVYYPPRWRALDGYTA